MHGPDVFISYAREDEGMARRFAEAFAQEGFTVWWDAALHSGETFDEVIEQELRASKAVVVLWSPHSVASRWVRAEATLADRNRTLAPAVIAPCNRPIIFELTHTADLSHWQGDIADARWKVFVKDIRRMVASGRAKDAEAAAAASAPAPAPEAPASAPEAKAPAGDDRVESLLSAVAALQEAIMKQGQPQPAPQPQAAPQPVAEPAPPPPAPPQPALQPVAEAAATPSGTTVVEEDEDDESDATQFYTHGESYALMGEVHVLEISIGGEPGERKVVGKQGIKIGRTAPADLVLADSKVSRQHATVELKDGQMFVADLGSTNGTFVDGQKVAGAAIVPVGSVLTIGHYSLVHEVRNAADL